MHFICTYLKIWASPPTVMHVVRFPTAGVTLFRALLINTRMRNYSTSSCSSTASAYSYSSIIFKPIPHFHSAHLLPKPRHRPGLASAPQQQQRPRHPDSAVSLEYHEFFFFCWWCEWKQKVLRLLSLWYSVLFSVVIGIIYLFYFPFFRII